MSELAVFVWRDVVSLELFAVSAERSATPPVCVAGSLVADHILRPSAVLRFQLPIQMSLRDAHSVR